MNMVRFLAFAALALTTIAPVAMADPATEQAAPAQTATTAQAPQDDPNEIVCRAGTPPTGTRLPGPRVCHTRREWLDLQQQSQDQLMKMQSSGMTRSN